MDVGEALGLLHALQWLADMQFDNVDFVADSKVIVYAFNSYRLDVTEFGHVILACRHLFSSSFTNSRVAFNRRQANVAAHILVGKAILAASSIVILKYPIVSIMLLVIKCFEHLFLKKYIYIKNKKIKSKPFPLLYTKREYKLQERTGLLGKHVKRRGSVFAKPGCK